MSTITKCVILARGLGKRMRQDDPTATLDAAQAAAAETGVKAMVPIGRPFLDYVLSALADSGFTEICLVIGPEHDSVREYYSCTAELGRIQIHFATQEKPLGTANAVLAAEGFCGSDEFLVINSDNYYPSDVLNAIQDLGGPGTILFDVASLVARSNIPAHRIQSFATCIVNADGYITDIAEKLEHPDPDTTKLVSMNCWRFAPPIFQACRDVSISPRNEFELPLAVKLAIQRGMKLKVTVSHSGVLDLSRRCDIAAVAERLKGVQVQL